MFQQITLGADFIETYREDINLLLKALLYLDQEETIFVDEGKFYKRIDSFLDELPDTDKSLVNGIAKKLLYGNIKSVVPDSFPVTPGEIPDEDFRRLLSIANVNGDRILVKYRYNSEYQLAIAVKTTVHVCSLPKYVQPGKTVPVANPRRVEFRDREPFDPKPILEPYLRLSKTLWIQDPYPLTYSRQEGKYRARPFLEDLFRMCPRGTIITLHSKSDIDRSERDRLTEEIIISKISDKCPPYISLNFKFGPVKDRPWRTDQFNIDIGHGIGIFYKNIETGEYENGAGENAYITITLRRN